MLKLATGATCSGYPMHPLTCTCIFPHPIERDRGWMIGPRINTFHPQNLGHPGSSGLSIATYDKFASALNRKHFPRSQSTTAETISCLKGGLGLCLKSIQLMQHLSHHWDVPRLLDTTRVHCTIRGCAGSTRNSSDLEEY